MMNNSLTTAAPDELRVIAEMKERQAQAQRERDAERAEMLHRHEAARRATAEREQEEREGPYRRLTAILAARFSPVELGELAREMARVDLRRFSHFIETKATEGAAAQRKAESDRRQADAEMRKAAWTAERQAEHAAADLGIG